ncbi:MAG: hypothetical protein HYV33_02275 [Candidatus Kerfeldbacteria bacterium]|nr:hypothetical protein [Candidatus Kerfeldbacteria bacterium]
MLYILILQKHWLSLLFITVVAGGAAAGLSLLPEQLYRSEVDLLIVQKQSPTVDSYVAQKAAEKLAQNLVSIIDSNDFFQRVVGTDYVDEQWFTSNPTDRKKQWQKLVDAAVVPETGIITIYGYGGDVATAEAIALGISQVLITNSADYHGAGESVQIKQIDGPLNSSRPVKPNIPLNGAAAAVLGFIVTFLWHVLRFEAERVTVDKQQLQYSVNDTVLPLSPPEYKVLDQFPVSMEDHLKK